MKHIAFFTIPAHGHCNPMVPVARELVRRGNRVRFYAFEAFREKIEKTGAEFVPCNQFLPELSEKQADRMKKVSTTEMTLQGLGTTRNMDSFLAGEMEDFRPDVIYTDSVCFWGKLTARKYSIPMVVSTSTFAFNQMSSGYMKNGLREMADLILGLPRINRELRKLEPLGCQVKSILSLVTSDNQTDSVVYTSRRIQPWGRTFSDHYAFVGPSLLSETQPRKENPRPLVYISMGTVINDRPDFYRNCIRALRDVDVIISCGNSLDRRELGELPENVQVYPYVDQLEVLARADAFITHCGMNSVSESLYMATPMVLYPQTNEQNAVARRTAELGAGVYLKENSPQAIAQAVRQVLENPACREAAESCARDLRSAGGPEKAAEFIETAPHPACPDPMAELNRRLGRGQLHYWMIALGLMIVVGSTLGWNQAWVPPTAAGLLNPLFQRLLISKMERGTPGIDF